MAFSPIVYQLFRANTITYMRGVCEQREGFTIVEMEMRMQLDTLLRLLVYA